MTNIWDRYAAQCLGNDPDKRCPFCMGGVRCDLCSNGPCRADAEKDKTGVCGIKADGMAMRMMLLRNVLGTSTYHYHTEQTLRTLEATVRGLTPFRITEPEKLTSFARRLGVDTAGSMEETALRLCDFVRKDFHRPAHESSEVVARLTPADRQALWKKLDIFPGGIYAEMLRATSFLPDQCGRVLPQVGP